MLLPSQNLIRTAKFLKVTELYSVATTYAVVALRCPSYFLLSKIGEVEIKLELTRRKLPGMGDHQQASLLLKRQLKELTKNPLDGFSAGLVDDSNLFVWNVTIIGPPDTLYEGGFFNAIMNFPHNYPLSPPTVRFTSKMWHPNVYPDGRVCISILHPPGEDPSGYELASERWLPVHTVETILLSIISMLSSPNDESPANLDAAKEWRENRDEFKRKVKQIVRKSQEIQ